MAGIIPIDGFGGGGGGGDGGGVPFVPSGSPFADAAARNAYFSLNPDELINTPELYTLIQVTDVDAVERWVGNDKPSVYGLSDAGDWFDVTIFQIPSDWSETNPSSVAFIQNKPSSMVSTIYQGGDIQVDNADPSNPVISLDPDVKAKFERLFGSVFGNEVGLAGDDSPYTADVFDTISVSILNANFDLTFPAGLNKNETITLEQVIAGNGGYALTIHSSEGFTLENPDGTTSTDTTIIMRSNINIRFRWDGATWRFEV
ncbi:hypothetical protein NVP1029O_13 [Vibrio phage 1.029.O._10N.261.55.A7]|nr:hypothetical protein NVP1029O_13 [Vibrio phage 1.029.O._10N.261.55.A7]